MTAFPAAPLPTPSSLRLVRAEPGGPVISPPLGVTAWSDDPDADVAVVLARTTPAGGDPAALDAILKQLPAAATLREGTLVVVLGSLEPSTAFLGRFLRARPRASRSDRCTALLAAGYTRLGAGTDPKSGQDLAWGYA